MLQVKNFTLVTLVMKEIVASRISLLVRFYMTSSVLFGVTLLYFLEYVSFCTLSNTVSHVAKQMTLV